MDINTRMINIDDTNLSGWIFWRNNNLSIKDAFINSIQLLNIDKQNNNYN